MEFINKEIEDYAISHSSRPSENCKQIQLHTSENIEMPQMLSGEMEGSLLGFLVRMVKPKTIIEIGTYTGYCTLNLAENTPSDCKVYTLDISDEFTAVAKKFWKKSSASAKINLLIGPALESLETINDPFDFVFIDADKINYLKYLKLALAKLSPSGVIAVDNVLWSGKVLNSADEDSTKAIQELNEFVKSDETLYKTLLPIRDGVFLIQKKA